MKKKQFVISLIVIGVVLFGLFAFISFQNKASNEKNGNGNDYYSVSNENYLLTSLPIPTGDLYASSVIMLPDVCESGKGFTCTGLAYDADRDTFLVGDIGILLPGGTIQSYIHMLSHDFTTINDTISISSEFSEIRDIQGITVDTSNGTIWFCAPSNNMVCHMNMEGIKLGSFSVNSPTGIAYSPIDDTLWVLNYKNEIIHMSKKGKLLDSFDFAFSDTLDQCFLDSVRGYLYITAGANYSSRNNVYLFDINTCSQSIACTVDSYSVEGLWIGETEMVIVNDGYYHGAKDPRNVVNIYDLE